MTSFALGHDAGSLLDDNIRMIGPHLHTIGLVWRAALIGGAVILAGAVLGWKAGQARGSALVRFIGRWLRHVVRPLLGSESWLCRASIIAANNALVCLLVVLSGATGSLGWLAVGGIGLGLGVAVRLTVGVAPLDGAFLPDERRGRAIELIGLALNTLELPAIMLTAGLCLGQGALVSAVDLGEALGAFGWCVVPLLLVAAAGEALWMGRYPDLSRSWSWHEVGDGRVRLHGENGRTADGESGEAGDGENMDGR